MKPRVLLRLCTVCVVSLCALFVAIVPAGAQAQTVTLAWEANPEDPAGVVAGYFVYVTLTPGFATLQFDAGSNTWFAYSDLTPGVGYSFAVAAYTSDGIVSPPSESVFYLAGSLTEWSRPTPVGPMPVIAPVVPSVPTVMCVEGAPSSCYTARTLMTTSDHVTALALFPDGRVAIAENGRHVRIIDGRSTRPLATSALTVESPVDILGLAIDPAFQATGAVFASLVQPAADGRRQLSIARYRELGGALGQGAAIVAGIPVPATGNVPFTIDPLGRVYVAVPSEDGQGRRTDDVYASRVLRFEPDGSAAIDNGSASPLFAHGYAQPRALVWDARSGSLWMSGRGAEWTGEFAFVPKDSNARTRPRIPTPASSGPATQVAPGVLTSESFQLSLPTGLVVSLIAGDDHGVRFVVVRDTHSTAETLLRLDPR